MRGTRSLGENRIVFWTCSLAKQRTIYMKFLEAEEKYKCLYETSPQYISKDEHDKAWNCIAKMCCSTGMYPEFVLYINIVLG